MMLMMMMLMMIPVKKSGKGARNGYGSGKTDRADERPAAATAGRDVGVLSAEASTNGDEDEGPLKKEKPAGQPAEAGGAIHLHARPLASSPHPQGGNSSKWTVSPQSAHVTPPAVGTRFLTRTAIGCGLP